VDLDSPTEYEVAAGTERDKERTENDEVDVEVRVFDVQLAQHIVRVVE